MFIQYTFSLNGVQKGKKEELRKGINCSNKQDSKFGEGKVQRVL